MRILSSITHEIFLYFTDVCTVILDGTLIKIIINTRVTVKMTEIKIKKGKAIPVTGRGGPQGCETFRFQHF
jgi:hypothetical protein